MHQTICGYITSHANITPEKIAYVFVDKHERTSITYAMLLRKIKIMSKGILERCEKGDRLIIQLDQGQDYVIVFLSCLYSGVVPVPLYPGRKKEVQDRVEKIMRNSDASLSIVDSKQASSQNSEFSYLTVSELNNLSSYSTKDVSDNSNGSPLAYLQYSSGSTSDPKGIKISHSNILANVRMITESAAVTTDDVVVSWLPLYHDLGLVNTLLMPIFAGCPSIIATPQSFARDPMSWLLMISEFGGTISGAPNSAYEACSQIESKNQAEKLSLKSWRVAFNGAEPISRETLLEFTSRFKRYGFKDSAFFPAYGMAEATVFVSGGHWHTSDVDNIQDKNIDSDLWSNIHRTVPCGIANTEEVIIVNDDFREQNNCCPGEIWIKGHHVSEGYYQPETDTGFGAYTSTGIGPYFRTGDRGVIVSNKLYVLGRLKELIILNGRNIYPSDVESIVTKALTSMQHRGRVAVVAKHFKASEAPMLIIEVKKSGGADYYKNLSNLAYNAVYDAINVVLSEIVFVPRGTIKVTSSGKTRRLEIAKRLRNGELDAKRIVYLPEDIENRSSKESNLENILSKIVYDELGQQRLHAHQNLFSAGASSINIVAIVSRINDELGVDISAHDVFAFPTIGQLASRIVAEASVSSKIDRDYPVDDYSLTDNQELMLTIASLGRHGDAYNLALGFDLNGEIHYDALIMAIETSVRKHEILRTRYDRNTESINHFSSQVLPESAFAVEKRYVRRNELDDYLQEYTRREFNIFSEIPIRSCLLIDAFDENRATFLLVAHHIATDGWSLRIIINEIKTNYELILDGKREAKQIPSIPFRSHQQLRTTDRANSLDYWLSKLHALPLTHSLPLDFRRSNSHNSPAKRTQIEADLNTCDALLDVCKENKTTLFVGIYSILALAIARFSGESDITLGSFTSNRNHSDSLNQVGFFAQALVLRTNVELTDTFKSLLNRCAETVSEACEHAQISYQTLIRELRPERDLRCNPLFQICLNYHDYDNEVNFSTKTYSASRIALHTGEAKFDISIDLRKIPRGLEIEFEYNSLIFKDSTIEALAKGIKQLLLGVVTYPNTCVGLIPAVTQEYLQSLHQTYAKSCKPLLERRSIYSEFESISYKHPHYTSVTSGQRLLTYEELRESVQQLSAHILSEVNPQVGSRIVIYMSRSANYLISILSILKINCTYVPIDPEYYQHAIDSQLALIQPQSILADDITLPLVNHLSSEIPIVNVGGYASEKQLANNDIEVCSTLQPAYILFTSGSTGSPKAVEMPQEPLLNLVDNLRSKLVTRFPITLNYSSIGFDMHFTEIFVSLLSGGTVVIADEQCRKDPGKIIALINETDVSLLNLSYPVLCEMCAYANAKNITLKSLQRVYSTAQKLVINEDIRNFFRRHSAARLENHYGPTETHVVSTCELDSAPNSWPDVPGIGFPISGTLCFVTNNLGQIEPLGAVGELCIAGIPLANGYYGNPLETTRKFCNVSLVEGQPRRRIYKTGDLVRMEENGSMRYVGRTDRQTKIRGMRIDIADIESVISNHEAIKHCAVLPIEVGSTSKLVAFIVPNHRNSHFHTATSPTEMESSIKTLTMRSLPSYMLPDYYVHLTELKLTQNGKVDESYLRQFVKSWKTQKDVTPGSEMEIEISSIWERVLEHKQFDIETNFFEAGGDSISLMSIKREIDLKFCIDIDVLQLYEHSTIAAICRLMEGQVDSPERHKAPSNRNLIRRRQIRNQRSDAEI